MKIPVLLVVAGLSIMASTLSTQVHAHETFLADNYGQSCQQACRNQGGTALQGGRDIGGGSAPYAICLARDDKRPGFARRGECYYAGGGTQNMTRRFLCMCVRPSPTGF